MTKLDEFREYGFSITWRLINIGYRGSKIFKGELSSNDIIDFAIQKVMNGDKNPIVFALYCEYPQNNEEITKYIDKLTLHENAVFDIEFRKWRVLYVINHLPKPDTEFVVGLLELGDIWSVFDFPIDSPHAYQGRNNSLTPEQYYTQDNYNILLEKHEEWIDKEIDFLRKQKQMGRDIK
jgi:hypothetical protein